MGFFSGDQFHLGVSFRYNPTQAELNFWSQLLEQTSRILHDASDGAHSIGQVLLSTNSMGGADADIWVHSASDVWPNSSWARLWFPAESLDVSQDFMYYATILAHELCHYLYDLRDEYNNNTVCQGDITTEACMMEGYPWEKLTRWTDASGNDYPDWATFFPDFQGGNATLQLGQPTEYCHDGNHNATANNNQNNLNGGQSCWTYIADDANHNDIPYGLTAPGTGGPTLAAPAQPAAVTITELIPVQRFMLVLDRSGSMSGVKLSQMQVGANFWVDYVNAGEELGLVSYSTTPNLDYQMSEAPAAEPAATTWRDDRHNIIDTLSATGATAIGDAMRAGLNDIVAGGRASSQVMILFTDGIQNWGSETAQDVLPDLITAGVRCYTIGLGNDQEAILLSNIATTTGAHYFAIDGALDPDEAATAISEALIEIAGESRANGGIVSFQDVDGASVDAIVTEDMASVPFPWTPEGEKPEKHTLKPLQWFRFPVEITTGSTHCTLGVLWKHTKRQFRIRVYDPDGNPLGDNPQVRWVRGRYPYSFCEIEKPKAGTWQIEVVGAGIRNAKFRTIGFEVNDRIRLEVSPIEVHIRSGSEIRLRARLLAPQAVPGARITGWVRYPTGTWKSFNFTEHKGGTRDKEEPFVYTGAVTSEAKLRGQYIIVVDAFHERGTFELKFDELYVQKPGLKSRDMTRKFTAPRIRRRVLLTVSADQEGRSTKEQVVGYSHKAPWVPKNQRVLLEGWRKAHSARLYSKGM